MALCRIHRLVGVVANKSAFGELPSGFLWLIPAVALAVGLAPLHGVVRALSIRNAVAWSRSIGPLQSAPVNPPCHRAAWLAGEQAAFRQVFSNHQDGMPSGPRADVPRVCPLEFPAKPRKISQTKQDQPLTVPPAAPPCPPAAGTDGRLSRQHRRRLDRRGCTKPAWCWIDPALQLT